jgi:predicted TIM-barrel fold metal-dependent hydrolase
MPVVDIHTHIYPPFYVSLLRGRSSLPFIRTFDGSDRLIILPGENDLSTPSTSRGRPLGPNYWDANRKIAFMDAHGIDISVMSLANPWLDFLDPHEAASTAMEVNDDINKVCNEHPGRLYAFGVLPLSGMTEAIVSEVQRLKSLKYMRGVIMGTTGLGCGLDDPSMNPIWQALEDTDSVTFLHPHYGLPGDVYGPRRGDYGHVLPLALGFPLETTIAVTRMYLSGVWDRFPRLKMLIAHSGGTLPFLAGRIESCIAHDAHLMGENKAPRRNLWEVLRQNIYLDAVIYSEVGLKAAVDASGADRLLFGTDHPFFPPLDESKKEWLSVTLNGCAVKDALVIDKEAIGMVMGGNALQILQLTESVP